MRMGDCLFEILQTPGHTLESICVVMTAPNLPKTVFTGDTLFVGDVGRPDLSPDHTPQELAAMLYQSLHTKLLTLPDDRSEEHTSELQSLAYRMPSSA